MSNKTKKGEEMLRPAFATNAQALSFLGLVIFALVLPILITKSGLISRRNSYEIMPENQGAYSFVMNEIFDNKENIDVLFVGSSVTFQGIDTPQVQKELSKKLGRPARVRTFGHYFNSIDISYMQIRDLLEHKRVGLVVLSIPRMPYTEGPSATAYRFIRYSDDKELFDELPLKSKLSLYACSVLKSPRDLLTMVRPNLLKGSPFAENLGADKPSWGAGRDPRKFTRFTPASPSIPTTKMIYSNETEGQFNFTNEEVSDHQYLYLKKIVELLENKKVAVMMLNIPQSTERQSAEVVERKDWTKSLNKNIPIVGVPPKMLFAGLSEEEIEKFYYDDVHFNTNGNEYFTRTILPAILEIYDKYAAKNY